QHGLARRTVEAMTTFFPPSWAKAVKVIHLCAAPGTEISASFHAKEQSLSLCWPSATPSPNRTEAVDTLLIALFTVTEVGSLPSRLTLRARASAQEAVVNVRSQCLRVLSGGAA